MRLAIPGSATPPHPDPPTRPPPQRRALHSNPLKRISSFYLRSNDSLRFTSQSPKWEKVSAHRWPVSTEVGESIQFAG